MAEFSEQVAATGEQIADDAAAKLNKVSKNVLEFVFGAQKLMLEEIVQFSNEMLERSKTEMHLLNEFSSKLAAAHSVNDIKTMGEECTRHQVDFLRRDSERLFKHGERMLEAASKLAGNWQQH